MSVCLGCLKLTSIVTPLFLISILTIAHDYNAIVDTLALAVLDTNFWNFANSLDACLIKISKSNSLIETDSSYSKITISKELHYII